MHHGAKAARIMQAQRAQGGDQIEMVVRAGRGQAVGGRKTQAARHAQMQQQHSFAQIDQQVFAATAHAQHLTPDQHLGRQAQRPAQGLAETGRKNACTRDGGRKRAARDFNFG
ncbi:hypothetical protein D3C71_1639350 [compost metagenome]